MRRRIIPTRLLALTLAIALFLGNDYTIFPLAEVTDSISNGETTEVDSELSVQGDETPVDTYDDTGTSNDDNGTSNDDNGTSNDDNGTSNDDNGTSNGDTGTSNGDTGTLDGDTGTSNGDTGILGDDNNKCPDGEHQWVEDTENGGEKCGVCGIPKPEDANPDVEKPDDENENTDECQVSEDGKHHWVEDTENGGEKCESCGIPKPDDENENTDECPNSEDGKHHWVEDTENGGEKCESCGIPRPDDENEYSDVCPKSPTGKHLWLVTSNTCIFCGIEKPAEDPAEPECEHEWVTDPETGLTTCIKCGIEKPEEEEECEHEWVTDPETGLTTCIKCGIEKLECEHEWIRDPETLEVVCGICGEIDKDYVEEDPCPESKWGFHIYAENEDGTGYVCVLCGAEKEELDPLDVTEEMFMNSKLAIAPLIVSGANYDTRDASRYPQFDQVGGDITQLERFASDEDGYKTLTISCVGDLLVIQDWSYHTNFEGWKFDLAKRSIGNYPGTSSDYNWDLTGIGDFQGLGNEEFPFSGVMHASFPSNSNFTIKTPFFNWISTNAIIDGMSIVGNGFTSTILPMGLVAGTLIKKDASDADCVTFKNVRLRGSVVSTEAAGMIFGRVVAMPGTSITLLDDSADIILGYNGSGTVRGRHAGGFAGETEGDVTVNVNNPGVFGTVTVNAGVSSDWGRTNLESGQLGSDSLYNLTPAGGMYVGAMNKGILNLVAADSAYSVSVDKYSTYGGVNGGFVGMAIGTVVSTDASAEKPLKISNTVTGSIAGGVIGYYEHPADVKTQILTLDYITVSATINSTSSTYDYYTGGVLGRYYRAIDDAKIDGEEYDTIDHIEVSGAIYAYKYAGGVVGFVHGSNLLIGGNDTSLTTNERRIYVHNTIYGYNGYIGGVVGQVVGQYVEIQNANVASTFRYYNSSYYPNTMGGIVGYVGRSNESDKKSIIRITTVTSSSSYACSGSSDGLYRGGILGRVWPGNMVALDGVINVGLSSFNGYYTYYPYMQGTSGYIAAWQEEALIYLEENATYTRTSTSSYCKDDIGNYGGVYRNGVWGESEELFSYEKASVQGSVTKSGTNWDINSAADLIRLAVMLNTDGRFAANCFAYDPDSNKAALPAAKGELLSATYLVSSATGTLDLRGSGVYSLNRNDKEGFDQAFTGTFKGNGTGSETVTINLGDIETRQGYVALFPQVGDKAVISDFTLKRTIDGVTLYGAGIACRSTGNFTARNLYIDLTSDDNPSLKGINGFQNTNSSWNVYDDGTTYLYYNYRYFAGLVAKVEAPDDTTFEVENIKINGIVYGDNSYYSSSTYYYHYVVVGGMIADYTGKNTTISVNNIELMKDFGVSTATANNISGMITNINSTKGSETTLFMRYIKIHDGAFISQTTGGGSSSYTCGGWLGNEWKNVIPNKNANGYYSIANVTIGDGGGASGGPKYEVRHPFGGLVNTVTGRIQLKDIWLQNGIFNNAGSQDGVGLLFRVGNDAIIEIDGYKIAERDIDGVATYNNGGAVQFLNVENSGTRYYDEIVAYNMGPTAGNFNDYKTGGIVNIIYDDFSDGNGHHKVYQNRLVKPYNLRRTRYYYNLFGSDFENEDYYLGSTGTGEGKTPVTFDGAEITNEKQMMIWHLTQYMNDSIRDFLKVYYTGGAIRGRSLSTTFMGDINLDTVSYYPTPVVTGTYTFSSNITFHGQDITDTATDTMTPSRDNTEHYMLHAGLFINKENQEMTVRGAGVDPTDPSKFSFLTLSGSVSNLTGDTYGQNEVNGERKNNSGAVIVRDIKGKKNIYYVRFNGLYLANYTNEDPAGLMLGIVKDETTLDISWIETVGYESVMPTLGANRKAASALIGVVGDYEASKISIEFKNMKLDGRNNADGIFRYASLIDENYYKEDTENPSPDIRRIRYLFTKEAFLGDDGDPYDPFTNADPNKDIYGNNTYKTNGVGSYVTIGYELGEGIEYWNVDYGPEDSRGGFTGQSDDGYNTYSMVPFKVGTALEWDLDYIEGNYIPYVHRVESHISSKDIEVNPKNRSILRGCGTYEDPYIINNPRQLMALARYLQNKNDYKYLGNWQIHVFESGRKLNGDDICHQDHAYTGESNQIEDDDIYLRTYPNQVDANGNVQLPDGFPTQDELSQAYYMIEGDIDLSKMLNATDRQIAEDFVGLGTSKIPFRGVIVGAIDTETLTSTGEQANKDAQGRPTITLPLKSYWTTQSKDVNYGLIQYSIGTVVKDVVIEASKEVDARHKRTGVAKVENSAGGVMAIVIGGDNIIDNVSVDAYITLMGTGCNAGAYAGIVEQGSLILRNIPEDCAKDFYIGNWWNPGESAVNNLDIFEQGIFEPLTDLSKHEYVSGLIGKVEDGCVIYDDVFGNHQYSKPILEHSAADHTTGTQTENIPGIYSNTQNMPISKHYDIIVKSYLDSDMEDGNDDKITVTSALVNGKLNYTAKVDTSAQLQVVSMVINSDAFSVYPTDGGYKKQAACRKADYDEVGILYTDSNKTDRNKAKTEDDKIYYYPYLYQYFNFNGVNLSGLTYDRKDTRLADNGWQATLKEATINGVTGYVSTLNVADVDVMEIMNYELNADKDKDDPYNLAQYCRGFRGIGATYGMIETKMQYDSSNNPVGEYDEVDDSAFYSDFRANFNGNGAWIDLGMNKNYDQTIHTTALFNDLLDRTASKKNYFTIENIVITGFSKSVDANTDGNKNYPNRTAAVVGMMRRPWRLFNIQLTNMDVEGKGHTGGIVAWIEPGGTSDGTDVKGAPIGNNYEIIECTLDADTQVYSYGGSAGGIVAIVTQNDPTAAAPSTGTAFSVNLLGCQINGEADNKVEIAVKGRTTDIAEKVSGDYGTRRGVGRSGGFIGYVGRKNVASNALYVNVVIDNSKGIDGLTGLTKQEAQVVYALITGAYSTGGLIGTYDAAMAASTSSTIAGREVTINSAIVEDCEITGTRGNERAEKSSTGSSYYTYDRYYTYGVGGLIGEMRAYNLTIDPSKDDISLARTNVTSSQNDYTISSTGAVTYQSGYGMYAGGVVGCLKTYMATFNNITMDGGLGDMSGKTMPELAGRQYTVKSARSDAGGIIGYAAYGTGTLTMTDITVKGMNITADSRTETQINAGGFGTASSISGANGSVGGVIGTNKMKLSMTGTDVEDCMITGSLYYVGGIVGTVERYSYSSSYGGSPYAIQAETMNRINITRNIIGYNTIVPFNGSVTTYAGGVYGYLESNYSGTGGNQRLENAVIKNNWIYGTRAGGVLGYGSSSQPLYSTYKHTGDDVGSVIIEDNDMYGQYVGGAVGYCASSVTYLGTEIKNNRLQAYGTNGTTAYVGGFGGYVSGSTQLDSLSIEDNDILAGNNGSQKSIMAGGLFGYVASTYAFIYQPQLSDNEIGYCDSNYGTTLRAGTASNVDATLEGLFGASGDMRKEHKEYSETEDRTVYLVTGTTTTGLTTVAMPTTAQAIRDKGVSYYGVRVGNFVGAYATSDHNSYSSYNYHTYIMAPKVSYSASFKGTRPVIDVGMEPSSYAKGDGDPKVEDSNLRGTPYAYRRHIHIIYHDPENTANADAAVWTSNYYNATTHHNSNSSSKDEDWKYLFEGIDYDKVMKQYRIAQNGPSEGESDLSLSEYLDAYRLGYMVSETQSVQNVYTNLYRSDSSTQLVSKLKSKEATTVLPVIVLDTQYGTPDELMKGIVAALTGAGGVYADGDYVYDDYSYGLGTITNITTEPWVLAYETKDGHTMGDIYKDTSNGAKASLQASATAGNSSNNYRKTWSFTYDHFDDNGFDFDADEEQTEPIRDQTFTLVKITYSYPTFNYYKEGADGSTSSDTFNRLVELHIPVFVEERLIMDTYLRVVEGLEYNAQKAKADGYYMDSVTVANDSSYTFYTEYIYSDARKKYQNVQIGGKHIGTYTLDYDGKTEIPMPFAKGTKLTLIDIDRNNEVYYYTATGQEKEAIPFEDFTKVPGSTRDEDKYQYKDISDDDAGFLLVGEGKEHTTWETTDITLETWTNRITNKEESKRKNDDPDAPFVEKTYTYGKNARKDGTDDKGNDYVNVVNGNVAVERFLILVDISDVKPEDNQVDENEGQVRVVDYRVELKPAVGARTTLTEHTKLELTIVKGISIRFINKSYGATDPNTTDNYFNERTWIGGTITANEENGFVDIWTAIEVTASDLYWTSVSQSGDATIDSANHDKYLELQIYMTNKGDSQEIMLPSGTFGYMEGERTRPVDLVANWFVGNNADGYLNYKDSEGNSIDPTNNPEAWAQWVKDNVPMDSIAWTGIEDPYYNTSNIYFYKDGRLLYDMNELSKIITAEATRARSATEIHEGEPKNTPQIIVWVDHMRLDFRNAEMTPFDQSEYTVHVNLLRVEDPDYPAGGEQMDEYHNDLPAVREEELACALEAKELMDLGINLYDNQTPIPHEIEFEFKMDFNGVMTANEETNKTMADKHYTAAYRIYQKQFAEDRSYVYVPYNGEELTLELVDDPKGLALETDWMTVESEDGEEEVKFWYVDYVFDWNEIKKGTKKYYGRDDDDTEDDTSQGGTIEDDDETEIVEGAGVIIRDLQLTVNSVEELDLSNYKVQLILNVSDFGYPVTDPDAEFELNINPDITPLADFFIFTIAKLKTDLDY